MKIIARRFERGYNLIEVLIAMAILGVVILSIGSLFIWGQRNVYSGKQMTTAVAIGTRVLEDLAGLNKDDISYGVFDIAAGTTGENITFGNPAVTYTNAAIRSTNANALADYDELQTQKVDGPLFLTKWSAQLLEGGRPRLTDGAVSIIMTPSEDPNNPDRFGNSEVLQVRVIVQWRERQRRRQLILDTVKAH